MKRAALALGALILSSCPALARAEVVLMSEGKWDTPALRWTPHCDDKRPKPLPEKPTKAFFDEYQLDAQLYLRCIDQQAADDIRDITRAINAERDVEAGRFLQQVSSGTASPPK